MNGRVPDEGAVAETSMAWTLGKPIVLFKEDARSAIEGRDNPLIVGQTDFCTVRDMTLLPSALDECIGRQQGDPDFQMACPPHLVKTLLAGQRLWEHLRVLGDQRPDDGVAEIVLELFGPTPVAAT